MQALVWHGPSQLRVETVAEPRPRADEALVRVEAAGICGSEVEGYQNDKGIRRPPLVMGHEFAGTVTAIGEKVDRTWLGRPVTVNPLLTCGECVACRTGHRNVCAQRGLIGVHRPGAFADLVAVPASALVRLPDGLDPRLAALTEPLANGVHAVRLGSVRGHPEDAIVIGAGVIGLAALQAAIAAGIADVKVAEPHAARRTQAGALGARATAASVNEFPEGSAALVIDAVGRPETRAVGLALVRPGGTFVAIGLHSDRQEVSFHDLIRREVAVQGSYAYSDADFALALSWLATGKASIGPLDPPLPIADGPAAFSELARGASGRIKVFLAGAP